MSLIGTPHADCFVIKSILIFAMASAATRFAVANGTTFGWPWSKEP